MRPAGVNHASHSTPDTGVFEQVTDRAAAVLGLGDQYGIVPGRPASFILLPASGPFDVVRRQVRPSHVVAHGQVVASTPASVTTLRWPGRPAEAVDVIRHRDAAAATWREPHTTV